MANFDKTDVAPAPEQGAEMPEGVSIRYKSFGHVVMLGAPGGTFDLTGPQLVNVFGKYGKGNVIQAPNLLGVIMGDSNQLIIQPPKITMKAATEEILQELYRNVKPLVLRQFESHPSSAFGINFELEVEHKEIRPTELMKRLLGKDVPVWLTLQSASVKRESSNYNLRVDDKTPEILHININNHIDKPGMANFDYEMLTEEIRNYRKFNEVTIKELYECVQKLHS